MFDEAHLVDPCLATPETRSFGGCTHSGRRLFRRSAFQSSARLAARLATGFAHCWSIADAIAPPITPPLFPGVLEGAAHDHQGRDAPIDARLASDCRSRAAAQERQALHPN